MHWKQEVSLWWEVVKTRRGTYLFFSVLLLFLPLVFFLSAWMQRFFDQQLLSLSDQVELIVELQHSYDDQAVEDIQQEIASWEGVADVQYWDEDRVQSYAERTLLNGSYQFLDQHQVEIAFEPLFRIQLISQQYAEQVRELLENDYDGVLSLYEAEITRVGQSTAFHLLGSLQVSTYMLTWLSGAVLMLWLLVQAYVTIFFLSERSHGFHPLQRLHIVPPYSFWPTLLVLLAWSWMMILFSAILASLLVGSFLWQFLLMLWALFALYLLIWVWMGRYVLLRWGMR